MMVGEQHYDEETLLSFIGQDRPSAEHLSACAECCEKLDSYRLLADALADEATWDETPLSDTPNPDTIATLRAFADQMAAEDAQAQLYLPNLLDGTRDAWMSNLRHHPEYRTAGVVRKLIEAIPTALDTMPRDAVELAGLATEIADHLDPATCTADTVSRLRGAAWRERAYALFYTGDFAAAERALCASESHFTESFVNEYDLARVGVVRALVERGLEKYASAIPHARASAQLFVLFGDETKSASARLAEVHLLFSQNELDLAYRILIDLKNRLQQSRDADTYARVLGNLGYCCMRLGRIDEALIHHDAAAQLLVELGVHSEAVRGQWSVARILAREGRFDSALPRLRKVQGEFEQLGMIGSATDVHLDIAEILISKGAFGDVEEICRNAVRALEHANLAQTAPALIALALMQEAARSRTATQALVDDVRRHLRPVRDEPNLLFASPPE